MHAVQSKLMRAITKMQSAELGCKKFHFYDSLPSNALQHIMYMAYEVDIKISVPGRLKQIWWKRQDIINTNPSLMYSWWNYTFFPSEITNICFDPPSYNCPLPFNSWFFQGLDLNHKSLDLLYWLKNRKWLKSNSHIITYRVFGRLITGSLDWQNLTLVSQETDIIEHPAHA